MAMVSVHFPLDREFDAAAQPRAEPCFVNGRASLCSTSQGSRVDSYVHFAFWPSPAELKRALCLLDSDSDGKIWAKDFEQLVQVSFGVDVVSGGRSWRRLLASMEGHDGLLNLETLLSTIDAGLIFTEVDKLPAKDTSSARDVQSFSKILEHFADICEYVEAFNQFDKDSNGVVCAADLKKVLDILFERDYSMSQCKDIISNVTSTHSCVVDLWSFQHLLCDLELL